MRPSKEIERYFDNEPKPGTPEADRFPDLLALIVEDFERKRWPVGAARNDRSNPLPHETGGYPGRSWAPARLTAARIRHPDPETRPLR